MNNTEYDKMLKLWWERLRREIPKEKPSLPTDLANLPGKLDAQTKEVEGNLRSKLDELGIKLEDLQKELPPEEVEPPAKVPSPKELQEMVTGLDKQTAELEADLQKKVREAGVDLKALAAQTPKPAPSGEEVLPKDPAELIKSLDQKTAQIESELHKKLDELGIDLEELKKSPYFMPPKS